MEGMTPPVGQLNAELVQMIDAAEACAEAGVAEGEGANGRDVPCAEEDGPGTEAAYGLRERAVPEHRRMLEPEGCNLHDAGEPLHAAVGFCAVPKGKPEPIDFDEPRRVAYAVAQFGLTHAVITSVNRDDDNVGSARAFVSVIEEIRLQAPGCRVEVLTPDFQGTEESLRLVVAARPEILNHNIETVPRLYRVAKSGGRYERSLRFLEHAKEIAAEMFSDRDGDQIVTKTGIIVGWARRCMSCWGCFGIWRIGEVDILTIGQYLRPSRDHLPMAATTRLRSLRF